MKSEAFGGWLAFFLIGYLVANAENVFGFLWRQLGGTGETSYGDVTLVGVAVSALAGIGIAAWRVRSGKDESPDGWKNALSALGGALLSIAPTGLDDPGETVHVAAFYWLLGAIAFGVAVVALRDDKRPKLLFVYLSHLAAIALAGVIVGLLVQLAANVWVGSSSPSHLFLAPMGLVPCAAVFGAILAAPTRYDFRIGRTRRFRAVWAVGYTVITIGAAFGYGWLVYPIGKGTLVDPTAIELGWLSLSLVTGPVLVAVAVGASFHLHKKQVRAFALAVGCIISTTLVLVAQDRLLGGSAIPFERYDPQVFVLVHGLAAPICAWCAVAVCLQFERHRAMSKTPDWQLRL